MSAGTDNTFIELLPKMITLLGQMKQTQGADLAWIVTMENQVLAKQQKPVDDLRNSGQLPFPSGGMGQPGMGGAASPAPSPPGINPRGGGVPGGAGGTPQLADEMQRMLGRGAPGLGN